MAGKNNTIILTPDRAFCMEGIIASAQTPKPGTAYQIDYSVTLQGNRPTFTVYNRAADGNRPQGPVIILVEDKYQGKTMTDAYAAGARCFGAVPLPGCELNLLHLNEAGTADDVAVNDLMIIDDGTGKFLVTTGSPENEVAQALEAIVDPTADSLFHAIWTGY